MILRTSYKLANIVAKGSKKLLEELEYTAYKMLGYFNNDTTKSLDNVMGDVAFG